MHRYAGPKACSRVVGILMLADAVEAASRTIDDPTPDTMRSLVEQVFEAHVRSGELDSTQLTLGDLKVVAAEFQRPRHLPSPPGGLPGLRLPRQERPRAAARRRELTG